MEQCYPTSVALVRQMPLPHLLLFPGIVLFRHFLINFMRKIHSCSNKKKRLVTDFFASWIWAQNNLGKATQKFDTTDILQILNGSKVLDLLSLRIEGCARTLDQARRLFRRSVQLWLKKMKKWHLRSSSSTIMVSFRFVKVLSWRMVSFVIEITFSATVKLVWNSSVQNRQSAVV